VPTSFTDSVTLAPGGRPLATQSVVPYARFETQPLTPGGMEEFGVAVQVGVGPTRFCGGGMTVADGVGGRGLGVAGVCVFGSEVGGGVVAASGLGLAGTVVVAIGLGLAVAMSIAAGAATRVVSPQPTPRRAIAMMPARSL
jgi:hypothetical protein